MSALLYTPWTSDKDEWSSRSTAISTTLPCSPPPLSHDYHPSSTPSFPFSFTSTSPLPFHFSSLPPSPSFTPSLSPSSPLSTPPLNPTPPSPYLATVIPESRAITDRLRHRSIDQKRRRREARALTHLAHLLHLPPPPPPGASRKGAHHRLDRVALLEAACARLEAARTPTPPTLIPSLCLGDPAVTVGCISGDRRVTLACLTADTGEKVSFESVYTGVPQLQGFRSGAWRLIVAQLEAAYARGGELPPMLQGVGEQGWGMGGGKGGCYDLVAASGDPRGEGYLRGIYALLKGEVGSVQVEFGSWMGEGWVDVRAMVWAVPHAGVRSQDKPLTSGRLLVFASKPHTLLNTN